MPNRHKSYDDELAEKFEDLEFAQLYIMSAASAEGVGLETALRETVKAMGLRAFSEKSGLSIQAVSDFVSERQQWSTDKLIKKIGKVFGLKVKLSLECPETDSSFQKHP